MKLCGLIIRCGVKSDGRKIVHSPFGAAARIAINRQKANTARVPKTMPWEHVYV
jgi:hypothetical protein